MENIYTEHNITRFFVGFKTLKNSYNIEQVHQLLNNPNAKATHKVSSHFKHLKLIIMTSAFIIGITSLVLWLNPKESNKTDMVSEPVIYKSESIITPNEKGAIQDTNISKPIGLNKNISRNPITQQKEIKQSIPIKSITNDSLLYVENEINDSSQWPEDTILDKTKLFVKLTKSEQERIGIFYRVDSTRIPQMEKYSKLSSKGIHIAINPSQHRAWTFSMIGYQKISFTSGCLMQYISQT